MPIFEQTYRPWQGGLERRPRTWRVIAATGIRLQARRMMVMLLLLAAMPVVIAAIRIYTASQMPDAADLGALSELAEMGVRLGIDAEFFATLLNGQLFFLMLVAALAGSGLIANDRRFGALTLYFSKPVTRWDYLFGKGLVVAAYGLLVTLLPALLLLIMHLALATGTEALKALWWVPFSLAAQSVLMIVPLAALVLLLSAVAGSGRAAAILFVAAWLVPEVLRGILSRLPGFEFISLPVLMSQSSALLFGLEPPGAGSPWGSVAVLVALVVLCGLVLRARVRPTEVVA